MKKFKLLSVSIAIIMMFTMSASAATTNLYTFDDEFVDDNMSYTEMGNEWNERMGNPDSLPFVQEGDSGNHLALVGFTEVYSSSLVDEYVFSLDVKPSEEVASSGLGGIFVRCADPNNFTISQWPSPIFGFESDHYGENGGTQGTEGIGASGIYATPMNSCLRLTVKKYATDSTTISNQVFDLAYPEGVIYNEFFNLKFRDDGDTIEVLVNDELVATVELSEKGVQYASDNNAIGDEYFGKAVVKDATGAELGTVEKTRVSSLYSILSISSRSFTLWVDNVELSVGEGAISEDKGGAAAPDTDAAGNEETNATTNAPTAGTSSSETNKVATDTKADTTTSNSGDLSGGGMSPAIIVIIVVAVVAVVAVVVVVLGKKKK